MAHSGAIITAFKTLVSLGSALAIGACACSPRAGAAQPYVIRDLGRPPSAVGSVMPLLVSESAFVGGVGLDAAGRSFGFVWLPRAYEGLDAGMNETGSRPRITRVGTSVNSEPAYIGTYSLGDPTSYEPDGRPQAAVWRGGITLQHLGVLPGGERSIGTDINARGDCTGASEDDRQIDADWRGVRGFIWTAANGLTPLALCGSYPFARAEGLNDAGTVVGSAHSSKYGALGAYTNFARNNLDSRAVIWRTPTTVVDLNNLVVGPTRGLTLRTAKDITNHGQIICTGVDAQGVVRTALLTPVGADFNADGRVDEQDALDFRKAYVGGDARADYTGEGALSADDLNAFMSLHRSGTGIVAFRPESAEEERQEKMLWQVMDGIPFDRYLPLNGAPTGVNACALLDAHTWLNTPACWNTYHPILNPDCFGCDGNGLPDERQDDGYPGWPGDDPMNPYRPDGGPGGNGCPGDDVSPGGNGGAGGSGTGIGIGGAGGNGGYPGGNGGSGGSGAGKNGSGGPGGNGAAGGEQVKPGRGGNGGSGNGTGNGGPGGAGGDGKASGPNVPPTGYAGGDGGDGGSGGNQGGSGGNGGPGGAGDGIGNGGKGGDGGPGGRGAGAGPAAAPNGGHGGNGGSGGGGGNSGSAGGRGGASGPGGNAAPGGKPGNPGTPGDGGRGGNAGGYAKVGGHGGAAGGPGGSPGQPGSPPPP